MHLRVDIPNRFNTDPWNKVNATNAKMSQPPVNRGISFVNPKRDRKARMYILNIKSTIERHKIEGVKYSFRRDLLLIIANMTRKFKIAPTILRSMANSPASVD